MDRKPFAFPAHERRLKPPRKRDTFLTDVRHHKDDEVRDYPQVCLSFGDPRHQKYVSISGQAQIANDREMIKKLWSLPAKAWWESADDPNIRVITVTPEEAEWWDSPGTMMSYVSMAAAAITGSRPAVGEHHSAHLRSPRGG
jgi:general stress protein 26